MDRVMLDNMVDMVACGIMVDDMPQDDIQTEIDYFGLSVYEMPKERGNTYV